MKVFLYLLVAAITVLVTIGCVYGFSRVSCEGCEGETETAEALSVTALSDDTAVEYTSDEDETVEAKQWVKVVFDVVVIVLSVGVMVCSPYGP